MHDGFDSLAWVIGYLVLGALGIFLIKHLITNARAMFRELSIRGSILLLVYLGG